MTKSLEGIFPFFALVLLTLAMAGCATTADRKVTLLYEPTVHAVGEGGKLYLAREAEPPPAGSKQAVQWVIGSVKDTDGNKTGSIVVDTLPADLVLQALSAELMAAGYAVVQVSEVPSQATKGLSLSNTAVSLDDVSSLVKDEAKGSIKASVEVWRDGQKVARLSYETVSSDVAVTGRERLLPDILGKTMHHLMREAVPAVIKVLEQK